MISIRAERGTRRLVGRALALPLFVGLAALGPVDVARPQAAPAPQRTVVRQVRLGLDEDAPVRTLLLEGGRIAAVLEPGAAAPGARVVEGEGLIALPAFVDACTTTGVETPEPVVDQDVPVPIASGPRIDMREAGRKGVQPSFRAVEALALAEDQARPWREAGFGAMCVSPAGQLLAGTSALVTTRDAAPRDLVLVPDVWMQAAFRAAGRGYPSTLMGYLAQLRQLFLDAQRHAVLTQRHADGRPGRRPPFDRELEAALPLLAGELRVACRADRAADIERWIALADEAGLRIAIVGGREAWRLADELAAREIPVVLTLDWGEEVEDPQADQGPEQPAGEQASGAAGEEQAAGPDRAYEEPLGVRAERRREWEQGRDCALRLAEAGVPFVFGSDGGGASELVRKVRTLVQQGLERDLALAALTSRCADLLGAGRQIGALEPGRDATLCLWTRSPFEEGATPAWLFVDGFAHEQDVDAEDADAQPPGEGVDATGTWALTYEDEGGTRRGRAVLAMAEDGVVSGTLTAEGMGGEEMQAGVEGRVSGSTLTLRGAFSLGEMEIAITLTAELEGDELSGESVGRAQFGEFTSRVRGTREPQGSQEVQR
jgi:imidazolonepropionase-like amidohydrolase